VAALTEQDAALDRSAGDLARGNRGGFLGIPVSDKLDGHHQSRAADVSDQRVASLHLEQARCRMPPAVMRLSAEIIVFDRLNRGEPRRERDRPLPERQLVVSGPEGFDVLGDQHPSQWEATISGPRSGCPKIRTGSDSSTKAASALPASSSSGSLAEIPSPQMNIR
jgi:hypothetical protein